MNTIEGRGRRARRRELNKNNPLKAFGNTLQRYPKEIFKFWLMEFQSILVKPTQDDLLFRQFPHHRLTHGKVINYIVSQAPSEQCDLIVWMERILASFEDLMSTLDSYKNRMMQLPKEYDQLSEIQKQLNLHYAKQMIPEIQQLHKDSQERMMSQLDKGQVIWLCVTHWGFLFYYPTMLTKVEIMSPTLSYPQLKLFELIDPHDFNPGGDVYVSQNNCATLQLLPGAERLFDSPLIDTLLQQINHHHQYNLDEAQFRRYLKEILNRSKKMYYEVSSPQPWFQYDSFDQQTEDSSQTYSAARNPFYYGHWQFQTDYITYKYLATECYWRCPEQQFTVNSAYSRFSDSIDVLGRQYAPHIWDLHMTTISWSNSIWQYCPFDLMQIIYQYAHISTLPHKWQPLGSKSFSPPISFRT